MILCEDDIKYPTITLKSIENQLKRKKNDENSVNKGKTGCGQSLSFHIRPKVKENNINRNRRIEIETGKQLQIVSPIYYHSRVKVLCNKSNCKCEYHRMKKLSVLIRGSLYNLYSNECSGIRGSYGDFVNILESEHNHQRPLQEVIKNTKQDSKKYFKKEIIRTFQVWEKNTVKDKLDCKNTKFQNFLKNNDQTILKKQSSHSLFLNGQKVNSKEMMDYLNQRIHLSEQQMRILMEGVIRDEKMRKFYMRKFLLFKRGIRTDVRSGDLQGLKRRKQNRYDNNMRQNLSKKSRQQSNQTQVIERGKLINRGLNNIRMSQSQVNNIVNRIKNNEEISTQLLRRTIDSALLGYQGNLKKLWNSMKVGNQKDKGDLKRLSKMISNFTVPILKAIDRLPKDDNIKDKVKKKSTLVDEIKKCLENALRKIEQSQQKVQNISNKPFTTLLEMNVLPLSSQFVEKGVQIDTNQISLLSDSSSEVRNHFYVSKKNIGDGIIQQGFSKINQEEKYKQVKNDQKCRISY